MEVDIKLIQNKICHPVEEIRVRTLNSLLYKLEQNLLDPITLANETQLFKALLKSIEYGGSALNQVLSVLDFLTCEEQGTVTLGEAGALAILNSYKAEHDQYNNVADRITDKILSLPCKEKREDDTSGNGSTSTVLKRDTSSNGSTALNGTADVSDTVVVSSVINSTSDTSITSATNTDRSSDADVTKTYSDNIIFPRIYLNENDTKIIENIEERLLDDALFSQSCDFVRDVLLHDYPAETFLQKSGIVLNILKVIRDSNTICPDAANEMHAISAIARLIERLDFRVGLLAKSWVSAPNWNKSETDLNKEGRCEAVGPAISLPRLLFATLKCVLPVYKRCETEASAQTLTSLLLKLTNFLNTLNSAPVTFKINTNQLHNAFGLLGECVRCVYRRWTKTALISPLTPALLAALVSFSSSFLQHFIPPQSYTEYLPTTLLDVFRDLFINQTFCLSHRATYEQIEEVLAVTTPDIVEQRCRVRIMLEMIDISTRSTVNITGLELQRLYDGLEGVVHCREEGLLSTVVDCLLDNMSQEVETCTNSLVWLMSNKSVNATVYTLLSDRTQDKFISFHSEVLWELAVHGLTSPPNVKVPATQLLSQLLAGVAQVSPPLQLKFYRSLHPSLFFLICALHHIPELQDGLRAYLARSTALMTELEAVQIWVQMLWSRSEVVRAWPAQHLEAWAATQGVALQLEAGCLLVSESNKTILTISIATGTLDTDSIEKLKLISFNTTLSEELRVSAIQQLAVLLSDASVHSCFATLHDTLLAMLCDINVRSEMVLPILRCLRHIVHHNAETRHTLAHNSEIYASLLRIIGRYEAVETCYEVDREVIAEVGTILLLLLTHSFSSPTFWSDRSYYDLYNVVLPDSVPLSLHLPTHLTTLAPLRPLPPPVIPTVWLAWLQVHYHVQCSGGVQPFLKKQCEQPSVENLRQSLQVAHIPFQLPNASAAYIEIAAVLAALSREKNLLIQDEIARRIDHIPDETELLKYYTSPLPASFVRYFLSLLLDVRVCDGDHATTKDLLLLYSSQPSIRTQLSNCAQLIPALLTIFNNSSDQLALSQLAATCLSQACRNSSLKLKERQDLTVTLRKQIDTLSRGRGHCSSYMGAHILRQMFCCLAHVNTPECTNLTLRWMLPWFTDKDPVIRCTAFSLYFLTPDAPLTTESCVVLAISAFVDNSEIYTVRQQALSFINRAFRAVCSCPQTMALCVLVLKRLAFYDSCTAFVRELQHLVLYKGAEDSLMISSSAQITSYFEESAQSESLWNCNYGGLFYILDSILDVNLTLADCQVVTVAPSDLSLLLSPLLSLFTAEFLKSITLFHLASLDVYVSCFSKLLRLTAHCEPALRTNILHVLQLECQLEPVIYLKCHCLHFFNKLVRGGVQLEECWHTLLPLLTQFLAYEPLRQQSLAMLKTAFSRETGAGCVLQDKPGLAGGLCHVLFEMFSKFSMSSAGDGEMLCVAGTLCHRVPACRELALRHGLLEICYEYLLQLSQHFNSLAIAAGKENTGKNNWRKSEERKGECVVEAKKDLLKWLSCVLYCLSCCVDGSVAAATRLTDLDLIPTLEGMWGYYCSDMVVLNYVVKLVSVLARTPAFIKTLLANKTMFARLLEAALNSARYTKHPTSPLRPVLFDMLCVLSASNECVAFIWKSGFMSNFPKLEKQRAQPSKLGFWLKLLLHGTYTKFGQKMVLTVPHMLDVALEAGDRYTTLLLVRNLVFNTKSHPKLLNHGALMDYVMSSVAVDKPKQTVPALQAMFYFVKFSSKAKLILRNKGAGQVLGKLDLLLKEKSNAEIMRVLEPLLVLYM